MSSLLKEIVARKALEVEEAMERRSLADLRALSSGVPTPRDFHMALKGRGPRIIAECKRRSPSAGILSQSYDPVAQASSYEDAGASAISVLTDRNYFGGSLQDLSAVKDAVSIPVLRKDFIIDEYQVYEARCAGADSFLLISGVLDVAMLQYLIEVGRELGMEPLVEAHSMEELNQALRTDAKIIGINNRDLNSMTVDPNHALHLLERTSSANRIFVYESGVRSEKDVSAAMKAGFTGFLVGELFMRAANVEQAMKTLMLGRASL